MLVTVATEDVMNILAAKMPFLMEPHLDPANHSPSNPPTPAPAPARQPSKGGAWLKISPESTDLVSKQKRTPSMRICFV
jgi:hypothetical protein